MCVCTCVSMCVCEFVCVHMCVCVCVPQSGRLLMEGCLLSLCARELHVHNCFTITDMLSHMNLGFLTYIVIPV